MFDFSVKESVSPPQLLRHDPAAAVLPARGGRRAPVHLLVAVRQRHHVVLRRTGETRGRADLLPGQGGRLLQTGSGPQPRAAG